MFKAQLFIVLKDKNNIMDSKIQFHLRIILSYIFSNYNLNDW